MKVFQRKDRPWFSSNNNDNVMIPRVNFSGYRFKFSLNPPLKLVIHVVQNRPAGDQDKQDKQRGHII